MGAIWGAGTGGDVFILLAGLAARVIGTCAAFYTLFLCRMLGAGDIKLMALCTGLLGMGPGLLVIFTGLFLARRSECRPGGGWPRTPPSLPLGGRCPAGYRRTRPGCGWSGSEPLSSAQERRGSSWNIREGRINGISCGWVPGCSWDIVYGWLEDISEEVREDEKDHGSLRRGSVLCGTAF